MQIALESFAREYVDENTLVVLLWDQAGFHQTANMELPEGIRFFALPPYTPELQPAERLWPCLHEAMANRWVRTLDHLEELLSDRIRVLIQAKNQVRALTNYEWIHLAQNAIS